jgi:hypothetical protein
MDWLPGWPLHNVEIRWKVSLFKIVWQSKNNTNSTIFGGIGSFWNAQTRIYIKMKSLDQSIVHKTF